ncbi:MAG: NAD(+)/NADH kinase [Clostridia bacterium]|nr:NAD(+)/NADH kinase [Clostridia bacterium]
MMKIRKLHIITGAGKDKDGAFREKLLEIISECGAKEVAAPEDAELIVVLGGDGSIMHASHTAQKYDIPLLGVNLGRIGYLAELETTELHRLREVLEGRYTEERRMMLTVSYGENEFICLNDVVIRAQTIHPARVTLKCDGQTVNTYRGDGLICSTPTGSTAYSVSAGGAVVDPRLECVCITPLCTQSLIARPLIFSPDCLLTMKVEEGYECMLTVDGDPPITLSANDEIQIGKCSRPLRMLRVSDDGFYTVLNKKLYI